jgi:hypothetical protein
MGVYLGMAREWGVGMDIGGPRGRAAELNRCNKGVGIKSIRGKFRKKREELKWKVRERIGLSIGKHHMRTAVTWWSVRPRPVDNERNGQRD